MKRAQEESRELVELPEDIWKEILVQNGRQYRDGTREEEREIWRVLQLIASLSRRHYHLAYNHVTALYYYHPFFTHIVENLTQVIDIMCLRDDTNCMFPMDFLSIVLPRLEKLFIHQYYQLDSIIQTATKLTALECCLKSISSEQIKSLTTLQSISLFGTVDGIGDPLSHLTALKQLHFTETFIVPDYVLPDSVCNRIEVLGLHSFSYIKEEKLRRMINVVDVRLTERSNISVLFLENLPHLSKIMFTKCGVNDDDLRLFTKLKILMLVDCQLELKEDVFSGMFLLETLVILHSGKDVSFFKKLPHNLKNMIITTRMYSKKELNEVTNDCYMVDKT